ncbi:ABC transporter ATP-binding protein [Devosia albogilva]|uniref:ABC transporter ATP-binding protein n=1 Tax=Devosia albogilva TaxID=429726 RepID=A0ABW5QHK0_9HYPH
MTAPLLTVRDLTISFGQTEVVHGVGFEIKPGEALALVGESGSGKSVTAASILRLLPPQAHVAGFISFEGTDLAASTEPSLRGIRGNRVGMIFQEPMSSLNPVHTVGRQVGEVLAVHQGLRPNAARVRVVELLRSVGIPDPERRLEDYPHQLSGGQRQRVMIAMALANDPALLIADEPTTALDVTVEAQILALLKAEQQRRNMAMLFITHDLGIVRRLADRVAVMTDGRIVETGPVADVFSRPQHEYTRHLLAAAPRGTAAIPAADAPVVAETRDLKVWYPIKRGLFRRTVGHIRAVDGVDLTVREGETVGIVGESGSGKSSLGYALLRLLPSTGSIVILGNRIHDRSARALRPLRRQMQVVFQDPYGSLSPRMSVAEIVGEGLGVHRRELSRAERDRRVAAALTEVGLDPAAGNRYPHEFSGGQRQRIAIARALVLEPRLVVLDEPTSALDVSIQAQIVDLLREIQQRRNLSYVFISHDLRVVRALANRVLVMRSGMVVEQGPTEAIFSDPRDPYTRELMTAAFGLAPIETLSPAPEPD